MAFVFPAPPTVAVPVVGTSDAFAVRRVYCVGRNYADHAKEMGGEVPAGGGYYYPATVLTNVPADARVLREETARMRREAGEAAWEAGRQGGMKILYFK